MLSKYIHDMLEEILYLSYPDKEFSTFWIELISKEMKSIHGDYTFRTRKIRIFNLSRKTEHIITTTIHELAHHVELNLYGSSGHSKRFYECYRPLIDTAIKMGIITAEEVRSVSDARDIRQLERYTGEIKTVYDETYDNKKELYIIKVTNSYSFKDTLKARGYKYNSLEQCWCLQLNEGEIEDESIFLSELTGYENISITPLNDMKIEAVYYIIVKGCFEYKDQLKSNGYRYKGYNKKGNVWVKKIKATNLDEEEKTLRKIHSQLKYKVEGTK